MKTLFDRTQIFQQFCHQYDKNFNVLLHRLLLTKNFH